MGSHDQTELLEPELDQRFRQLGFDPGLPVYRHRNAFADLSVDHIKAALFDSSYDEPVTVPLFAHEDESGLAQAPIGADLPMHVLFVQPIWIPAEPLKGVTALGCYEEPDWYLRGLLHKDDRVPTAQPVGLHAYIQSEITSPHRPGEPSSGLHGYVQVVPEPSGAEPDRPLRLVS